MRLLIMGPQGVGKGTQAAKLAEHFGIPAISTGDIFRYNLKNQTELGKQAQAFIDKGELVPDELTNSIVKDRLAMDDAQGGWILDGYPRNEAQAVFLDKYLAENGTSVSATLYFEVSDSLLRERLLGRGRADDTPEVIDNRLAVNKAANLPLVDYYQKAGVLHTIDGGQELAEVYHDVKAVLDNL